MKINLNSTCQISAKDSQMMDMTPHLYRINFMWNNKSILTSEYKTMPESLDVLWKDEDI